MVYQRIILSLSFLASKTQFNTSNIKTDGKLNISDDLIQKSIQMVKLFQIYNGAPGISLSVKVGDKVVFNSAFGYSDVENLVHSKVYTSYRIASISKLFTSIVFGKHLESSWISLDDSLESLLPESNFKYYSKITPRHILTHSSGIRHYNEDRDRKEQELYSNIRYNNTLNALDIFINDEPIHSPGERYSYSTYAFTLLAYILENTFEKSLIESNKSKTKNTNFVQQLTHLFKRIGLNSTYLDVNEPLIANRSKRNNSFYLENSNYADPSYKYAGGGLISTVEDLVRFGSYLVNILSDNIPNPYITKDTLLTLWNPQNTPHVNGSNNSPGLGCFITTRSGDNPKEKLKCSDRLIVYHTGAAVGTSSILFMSIPCNILQDSSSSQIIKNLKSSIVRESKVISECSQENCLQSSTLPVVVAILTNIEEAKGIFALAYNLSELWTQTQDSIKLMPTDSNFSNIY